MVTTELTHPCSYSPSRLRTALGCTIALWLTTVLATAAGALDPALAPGRPPHPTIHPGLGAWVSILANNARVLCAPIVLAALGLQHHRCGRRLGDLAIVGVLVLNGGLVGLELGRWGARLLPYLPHLPLEWLATGTAASGWVSLRRAPVGSTGRHALVVTALLAGGLLAAAGAVEVLLTPHAIERAA